MTARRGRGLAVAVVGGLVSGGVALAGVSRAWARVDVVQPGMPREMVETLGTSVVPFVGALALVVVTGSLALLPTGGRMRQAVAVVVALAALGVVAGCAFAGEALNDAVLADLSAASATGPDPRALAGAAEHPPWRWLTLAAGLAGVVVGAWAAIHSATWPVMGSRYQSPVVRSGSAPAGDPTDPPDPKEPTETDLWRAMDHGDDPTIRNG